MWSTGYWGPFLKGGTYIQLIIFGINLYYLYNYYWNYFFTKRKIGNLERLLEDNIDDLKSLENLIKKKYFDNIKYYIIDTILSGSLIQELESKGISKYSKIFSKSKRTEGVLENLFALKNYKSLSLGLLSIFFFVIFMIFAFFSNIPNLFEMVEIKYYYGFFKGPFLLFILTALNFFIAMWTFILSQKHIKKLLIIIQDFEIVLTKYFKEKERK